MVILRSLTCDEGVWFPLFGKTQVEEELELEEAFPGSMLYEQDLKVLMGHKLDRATA